MEDKVAALRFIQSTIENPAKIIDDGEWLEGLEIYSIEKESHEKAKSNIREL